MNKFRQLIKRGYVIKVIIFRKNLPAITDWCKRINDYTYHLKSVKKRIPSPPSNDFVHILDKTPTIYLYSPRIGVYFYVDVPSVNINDTDDELKVDYKVKRHVTIKKPVKVVNTAEGEKVDYSVTEDTKAVVESIGDGGTISFSMEMFDHDDRNFQIRDIEETKNKYDVEEPWWKKHMSSLMVFIGFLLISISIYIVWQQAITPALQSMAGQTIQCVYTGTNSSAGVVI